MTQRTLSRTIPALLPTPQASDGERGPDYARQRERVETHGSGGDDLTTTVAKLLPTPVVTDSFGSRRSTARTDEWTSHPGTSLTDAIWETQGRDTDTQGTPLPGSDVRLLPTPQAADADGGRQEKGAMAAGGIRPSGQKATLPLPTAVSMREDISERPFAATAEPGEQASLFDGEEALPPRDLPTPRAHEGSNRRRKPTPAMLRGEAGLDLAAAATSLLPTPVANAENPGAGGELRAALVHGEGRRNETGVDTLGRPNRGRAGSEPDLLPTPNTRDHHAQGSGHNPKAHSTALSTVVEKTDRLLPTPTTQDAENTAGPSQHERNSDPLNVTAAKLLPTPTAADGEHASEQGPRFYAGGGDNPTLLGAARRSEIAWGVYEGAVRRWEAVLGRDAPQPTDEKGRLAPEFVEWMLGYPDGWFDLPDLKRTAKLRALGNSVQVQCGEVVGEWTRALVLSGILLEDA